MDWEQQRFIEEQAKAFGKAIRAENERIRQIERKRGQRDTKKTDAENQRATIRAKRAAGEGKIITRIATSLGWCETIVIGIVSGLTQNSWSVFWAFFIGSFVVASLLYFIKRDAEQVIRGFVALIIIGMSFGMLVAMGYIMAARSDAIATLTWIITLILMCFPVFRAFGWIGD